MVKVIFDWMSSHRRWMLLSLAAVTLLFPALISRLEFNEDIGDFLPFGTSEREALSVYQNISGANGIYILFTNPGDADRTTEAMDNFCTNVRELDSSGWCSSLTARFGMDEISEISTFVYENAPYFLTDADYEYMDSLLSVPGYMSEKMSRNREMLMLPVGGFLSASLSHDPLSLFSPLMERLRGTSREMLFESYDGYVFTPDMSRAVAMLKSPFGNSETECNSKMLDILKAAVVGMQEQYPDISVDIVGGPEIAVGNANCIKRDSVVAISLSVVLILTLLLCSFGSFRNILLIFLSIGWGWLFALGGMSLFSSQVSIIVIGISSVILGIAVNYPLHLVAHSYHTGNVRQALKEITGPLVVGNITTIGAFLALVPLKSTSLRDLGLFASLLLAGTILFVLVYLPHFITAERSTGRFSLDFEVASRFSPEHNRWIVAAAILLTGIFSVFSLRTEFDTNLANINYMTDEQKDDMAYFADIMSANSQNASHSLYSIVSAESFDEAFLLAEAEQHRIDSLASAGLVFSHSIFLSFLASENEQGRRLACWRQFVALHKSELTDGLGAAARAAGFVPSAFDAFVSLVRDSEKLQPRDIAYFRPLTEYVFESNVTTLEDTGRAYLVDELKVAEDDVDCVKAGLKNCFDVESMNGALASSLSDNFNYIGWACSLIVFFFLWFSFGNLELALISFIPMAVSWVWILGIMALAGIKFNIVNIILATFIFGQGDDYTIFITEGCQHEYAYRRPILKSYKTSILQSAMIMFIGIGTLIFARHPAMRSLAQVTIIGMASVVFMAYLVPPLLFGWLTSKDGKPRERPLTLSGLFRRSNDIRSKVYDRYVYKGKEVCATVKKNLKHASLRAEEYELNGNVLSLRDDGYGETAIALACANPDIDVRVFIDNDDKRRIAEISASGFVSNIEFVEKEKQQQ